MISSFQSFSRALGTRVEVTTAGQLNIPPGIYVIEAIADGGGGGGGDSYYARYGGGGGSCNAVMSKRALSGTYYYQHGNGGAAGLVDQPGEMGSGIALRKSNISGVALFTLTGGEGGQPGPVTKHINVVSSYTYATNYSLNNNRGRGGQGGGPSSAGSPGYSGAINYKLVG